MSLLQNAIDSIQVGVEDYFLDDDRRYLSATRNICAGILLLYKEKLRRLSPSDDQELLVKQSIKPILKNDELIFIGYGKKTVDVQTIKERFKGLNIQCDWQKFDKLNQLRNNIEHYYIDKSSSTVREVIVTSFVLIKDFIRQHLEEEPSSLLGNDCWQHLLETSEVYEAEEKTCRQSFEEFNFENQIVELIFKNIRCPSCHSKLIKATDQPDIFPSLSCSFCGNFFTFEKGIEEKHLSDKDPYAEGNYVYCNNCEYIELQSVVQLGNKWICFSCHNIHDEVEVGHCEYCGEFVAGNLEDSFLNGCLMCEGQMGHYMNSSKYP